MSRVGRTDSWQPVRRLLAVSRSREELGGSATLLFAASVAVANFLLCAYLENPIKEDPSGRALSTFFLMQGAAIFLLTLAHLAGTEGELLRKSLVLPVAPSVRLAFAVLSSARHPVLLTLVLTDVFFLLVLYHQSMAAFIVIPLLVGLMAADIVTLTSLAAATAIRRSRPPTIVAAYCTLGILGVSAIALLVHMPAILGMLPPMSWTAQGIMAFTSGEVGRTLLCGAAGLALLLLTAVLGRRFA